ncbi:MBL fold metallo-hydrolase [Natrarchaeobaculum aegyptiacum]|uniref:Hydrolase n=1 Tax=Natrarchaeobaculum aegyptiacum TaxID=745377 RepID=A0A2Z2HVC4_9EURY|nr:MBL fold metallo-hydrolase [Natrarchaeobaculum aegyptiacum]ARS91150.1 hydrolase [Natrarchaeobaculum aegyptiacum]
MTVRFGALTVDWLGHACVRLEGHTGVVIYVDPGPGRHGVLEGHEPGDGDLVVVSHGHHYDPASIRRVAHDETIVVVHEAVDVTDLEHASERPEDLPYEVERVRDDEGFVLGPLDLFTTPAFNDPAGPNTDVDGEPYHPDGTGCGFGITVDGVTVYWPGDTDPFEFHADLEVDLFLAPIGGATTMDRHEAADLAGEMRPDLVLPVRYDLAGERGDDADGVAAVDVDAFVLDVASRGVPVVLDSHPDADQ